MKIQVVIFVIFLKYSYGENCPESSPQWQINGNVKKILGHWFEISWRPPPDDANINSTNNYSDYRWTFYDPAMDNGLGMIASVWTDDNVTKGGNCMDDKYLIKLMTSDACYLHGKIKIDHAGGLLNGHYRSTMDWWVLATDFDNYALFKMCELDQPERCNATTVEYVLMGRNSSVGLSDVNEQAVQTALDPEGVNITDMNKADHYGMCLPCEKNADLTLTANFNIQKFIGRWYARYWFAPGFIDTKQSSYTDYKIVLDLPGTEEIRMSYEKYVTYKDPNKIDKCDSGHRINHQGQNPITDGHWYQAVSATKKTLYYVMSTDYLTYALILKCDGSCSETSHEYGIWSRALVDLSPATKAVLEEVLGSRCIKIEEMHEAVHGQGCEKEKLKNTAQYVARNYSLICIVVLLYCFVLM